MRVQVLPGAAQVGRRQRTDTLALPALLFLGIVALLAAGLLYLSQASSVATGGYDLLSLQAERDRWRVKNQQLTYAIAELSSLARAEEVARETLGMDTPEKTLYLKAW